jgi:hypothetical protein
VHRYLPTSDIEALSRIPPSKKMHEVRSSSAQVCFVFLPRSTSLQAIVLVPEHSRTTSPFLDEEQALDVQLRLTEKAALPKMIISGALLPMAELMYVLSRSVIHPARNS